MSNDTAFNFDVTSVSPALLDLVTERVSIAGGVLDTLKPEWRSLVDLDKLDMGSACDCVLGQVFGDFHEGMRKFRTQAREDGIEFNSYNSAEWFGFSSGYFSVDGEDQYAGSALLRHVWSEMVNGSPVTMRDRLLSGARSTVARFERNAESAKNDRDALIADFERLTVEYNARIEKATKRAEQTATTASEARTAFDALTADTSK